MFILTEKNQAAAVRQALRQRLKAVKNNESERSERNDERRVDGKAR